MSSTARPQSFFVRARSDLGLSVVIALTAMGVIAYLPLLAAFFQGMLQHDTSLAVSNRDFANYWVAAKLSLAGAHLDLFSQPVYFGHLRAIFGQDYPIHNWGYPPHFLLLLWPLGFLPYKTAMLVFLLVTLALFLYSAIVFRRAYAPDSDKAFLIFPLVGYAAMMVDTAQNGFLTGAALLFGLAWMKSRPALAGLAFAVLTIKPQLGFLIPILLLMERNYRTFAWASVLSAASVGLSLLIFGSDAWFAYFNETVPYQRSVMTDWYGIFLAMMPTTFGSIRTLGLSPDTAWLVQLPVSAVFAILALWLLRRDHDPLRKTFVLTCGTLLISPYAFNYDMGALCVSAGVLAGSGQIASRLKAVPIGMAAALSAAVMNLGRVGIPIAPIVLAAALLSIATVVASNEEPVLSPS